MRPGTKVMVLGLAAFAIYGYATRPSEPKAVRYQANAEGRLVQVRANVPVSSPLPKLFKPEPSLLLDHQEDLRLSLEQARRIRSISEEWLAAKGRLTEEIGRASDEARTAGEARRGITESLANYSELSRTFDTWRTERWQEALEVLSASQKEQLRKLLDGDPK